MSLAILVPVLGRPHRVKPLLESIRETAPEAETLFILSPDDEDEEYAVDEGVRAFGDNFVDYIIHDGGYAAKVNRAREYVLADLYFLAADDLNFHPGWLDAARRRMTDAIGVVGTNDLCNRRVMRGEHSTHSLVARWYAELGTIDEPGKLLHEGYKHEFVDDEFVATAKSRGAFVSAEDSVVEHLHPMVGKAPMDDLYAAQGARMRYGRAIFRRREHLWA